MNEKYNGWTNYATWRVYLEMFDGHDDTVRGYDATMCQGTAEMILTHDCNNDLTRQYAMAFISDVNWEEIADSFQVETYNEDDRHE